MKHSVPQNYNHLANLVVEVDRTVLRICRNTAITLQTLPPTSVPERFCSWLIYCSHRGPLLEEGIVGVKDPVCWVDALWQLKDLGNIRLV